MAQSKILLLEDDLITATDIKGYLQEAGYQVTGIARNYTEAMKLVKSNPPDLAIVDINLGKSTEDGISIAQDILAQHWMSFIYLTFHSDNATVQRASKTLPSAYLLKPFRPEELLIQIALAQASFARNAKETGNSANQNSFYLPFDSGHERVIPADILFLEAKGSCVNVHLTTRTTPKMIGMTLGNLSQHFSSLNFYRLSRSLYINMDHLKRIERTHIYMGETKLPVGISEANRKELLKRLKVVKTK